MLKIDSVEIARPEGSYYDVKIHGSEFGEMPGHVAMWNANGDVIGHVDITSWRPEMIEARVSDQTMGGVPGLMPGDNTVEVMPKPGARLMFAVPDPDEEHVDEAHEDEPTYRELVTEAETRGVKVDKRWGADRLRQELDEHPPSDG